MMVTARFDSTGTITQWWPAGAVPEPDDPTLIEVPDGVNPELVYVDVNVTPKALVSMPTRPSQWHTWDASAKAWADPRSLASVQAVQKLAIDRERERRTNLPIDYAGASFDGDKTAQFNVQVWQTQIAAGMSLPSGFVWRDAANVDHPADAAFINGLGGALTLRGTTLYEQAWTLKAQVDAATTIPDVESITWPA